MIKVGTVVWVEMFWDDPVEGTLGSPDRRPYKSQGRASNGEIILKRMADGIWDAPVDAIDGTIRFDVWNAPHDGDLLCSIPPDRTIAITLQPGDQIKLNEITLDFG